MRIILPPKSMLLIRDRIRVVLLITNREITFISDDINQGGVKFPRIIRTHRRTSQLSLSTYALSVLCIRIF
ncbi:hypothetical protein V1477_017096 [Vespula maculifrons]|uniref:Uncharacterized protein n=1 Tax=Vespula maculifrons TaxID=7453 RepID=A0ABD2B518_VESMC